MEICNIVWVKYSASRLLSGSRDGHMRHNVVMIPIPVLIQYPLPAGIARSLD